MNGKSKCMILKEIRKKIAEENDIEYVTSECTHKGTCKGTCPKCESELRYLERQLARRQALGKTACTVPGANSIYRGVKNAVYDVKEAIEELIDGNKDPGGEVELDGMVSDIEPLEGEVAQLPDDYEVLEGDVAMLPDDGSVD